jgi:hypothetical protein
MRKAMVMEWKDGKWTDKGEAIFHQFGCDFMQMNDGNVNYSTAIVELPDGTIENCSLHSVRFLDKAE